MTRFMSWGLVVGDVAAAGVSVARLLEAASVMSISLSISIAAAAAPLLWHLRHLHEQTLPEVFTIDR
jgi:hypothetical protein